MSPQETTWHSTTKLEELTVQTRESHNKINTEPLRPLRNNRLQYKKANTPQIVLTTKY